MDLSMKLVVPTMEYEKEIQAFRQEFVINGGDRMVVYLLE